MITREHRRRLDAPPPRPDPVEELLLVGIETAQARMRATAPRAQFDQRDHRPTFLAAAAVVLVMVVAGGVGTLALRHDPPPAVATTPLARFAEGQIDADESVGVLGAASELAGIRDTVPIDTVEELLGSGVRWVVVDERRPVPAEVLAFLEAEATVAWSDPAGITVFDLAGYRSPASAPGPAPAPDADDPSAPAPPEATAPSGPPANSGEPSTAPGTGRSNPSTPPTDPPAHGPVPPPPGPSPTTAPLLPEPTLPDLELPLPDLPLLEDDPLGLG